MTCPGCGLPEPGSWCWKGDFCCPLDKPPRYLDVWDLWRQVKRLTARLDELERPAWQLRPPPDDVG